MQEAGPGGLTRGTWELLLKKKVYLRKTQLPHWMPSLAKIIWSTQLTNSSDPVTIANGVLLAGPTYPTGPNTPWIPGQGKSYDHTVLEPLLMEASPWIMDASISQMDARTIMDPWLHLLLMEPHFLPSVSDKTMHLQCWEFTCHPWINTLLYFYLMKINVQCVWDHGY